MSELHPLDIVDDRSLAQIRADGDERWPDGRPYIKDGVCCVCGVSASDIQHACLLTIGYTEDNAQARIDAFLANQSTMLVDIRYRPYSRWRPAFNHGALQERYGDQYCLLLDLGNVHYNDPSKGIVLNNPEQGVRDVLRLFNEGHALMLMCACKDYEHCHRKVVYELVLQALNGTVKA